MKPWSKLYDRCQSPDCTTPHARHKGRGLCVNCNWKRRYHQNPEFQRRIKANAKAWDARHPERVAERVERSRSADPERQRAYVRKSRQRTREQRGVGHSAKWYAGVRVKTQAGYYADVQGPAYMCLGKWCVDALVEVSGEVVRFQTTELRRIG